MIARMMFITTPHRPDTITMGAPPMLLSCCKETRVLAACDPSDHPAPAFFTYPPSGSQFPAIFGFPQL